MYFSQFYCTCICAHACFSSCASKVDLTLQNVKVAVVSVVISNKLSDCLTTTSAVQSEAPVLHPDFSPVIHPDKESFVFLLHL